MGKIQICCFTPRIELERERKKSNIEQSGEKNRIGKILVFFFSTFQKK